jgi:hypothetical protein
MRMVRRMTVWNGHWVCSRSLAPSVRCGINNIPATTKP